MNRRLSKDVSDDEIRRSMEPRLASLIAQVVLPTKKEEKPAAAQSQRERRKEEKDKPHERSLKLNEEERAFLESTATKPLLSITQRRDELGLSSDAANLNRKRLTELGLVESVNVNLGPCFGGRVTFVEPTRLGWKRLGKKPPWIRPDNVSAEHFWHQRQIAAYHRGQGQRAEIEYCLAGKRADVVVFEPNGLVAFEVEMTPATAVSNVRRDLEAGFGAVVVAARNSRVRDAISSRLSPAILETHRGKVTLTTIPELPFVQKLRRCSAAQDKL